MMFEALIAALTFVSVTSIGAAVLTARAARRNRLLARVHTSESLTGSDGQEPRQPLLLRLARGFGHLLTGNNCSAGLREYLTTAGYHNPHAPVVYIGSKVLLLIAGVLGLGLVLLPIEVIPVALRLLIILWGAGFLFLLPNIFVRLRRHNRRSDIRVNLPDAIDLLEISVSAGMGLNAAWNSVADEIRAVSPTLADELALTNLEIHLGAPRKEAMKHMAERTGAEEISSLVGVLVQSERFGTSVAEALRTFANSMREIRSQRAEEAAEKMPVKLIFPLVLLLFPAVLIVITGPAALQWVDIISSS